jgi:hypothetical protein
MTLTIFVSCDRDAPIVKSDLEVLDVETILLIGENFNNKEIVITGCLHRLFELAERPATGYHIGVCGEQNPIQQIGVIWDREFFNSSDIAEFIGTELRIQGIYDENDNNTPQGTDYKLRSIVLAKIFE